MPALEERERRCTASTNVIIASALSSQSQVSAILNRLCVITVLLLPSLPGQAQITLGSQPSGGGGADKGNMCTRGHQPLALCNPLPLRHLE